MPHITLKCIARGFMPMMPIPPTSRWVLPPELTEAQIAHLNDVTRDLAETDKVVRSDIGRHC